MTAPLGTGVRETTHIWVPFRDTSFSVDCANEAGGASADGTDEAALTADHRSLLAAGVPEDGITREDRHGAPMWRIDGRRLHAVVEAFWSEGRPVRIRLDQAPWTGRDADARRMT